MLSACDSTRYKPFDGNVPCDYCGIDSISDSTRTFCFCKKNFFRRKGREKDSEERCFGNYIKLYNILFSKINLFSAQSNFQRFALNLIITCN